MGNEVTTGKDLLAYFNDTDLKIIAKDVVEHLLRFNDYDKAKNSQEKDAIGRMDYSYDLSDGLMKSNDTNTWFDFDLKPESISYQFMKAMYNREISEDENTQLNAFIEKIAKEISASYKKELRDLVRKTVMPSSDAKVVPLEKIDVFNIEIVDYSSVDEIDRHTFRYIKLPDIPVNMQAVSSRIMEVREENPLLSVNDIIHKERLAANPLFDALMGVDIGEKYLWFVRVAMWVDYSFSQEFLDSQKKG